jgi:hypothetical protein
VPGKASKKPGFIENFSVIHYTLHGVHKVIFGVMK